MELLLELGMQRHMWDDTEVNFLEEVNLVKVEPLAILRRQIICRSTVSWDCFSFRCIMSPIKVHFNISAGNKNLFYSL